MTSSRISEVVQALGAARLSEESIRTQGILGAARSAVLARIAADNPGPWLVLCPDLETAQTLADDATTLGPVLTGQQLKTEVLPEWDASPYTGIRPSLKTRNQRIASLHRITEGRVSLIFATPAALFQRTLPPAALRAWTTRLQVGSTQDRGQLVLRLLAAGYQRVDAVEDVGTFAARGEILDVYAPHSLRPWRIEFFDQDIERIREFDPKTQRAHEGAAGAVQQIEIEPACEVLINAENAPNLKETIKRYADDQGISRIVRDPVVSSIAEGFYNERSPFWAPFAYAEAATAWDHLPEETRRNRVVWIDELGTLQNWDAEREKLRGQAKDRELSFIVPHPDLLFAWSGDLDRAIHRATGLYMDQVVLVDTAKTQTPQQLDAAEEKKIFRSQVMENTDLAPGSKKDLSALEPKLQLWKTQGFSVTLFCSTQTQLDRVKFLLEQRELRSYQIVLGALSGGFRWPAEGLVFLTDSEILGTVRGKSRTRARASSNESAAADWSGLQNLTDLSPGDAVVHVDHGIGRYQGLARLNLSGADADFLLLEYAGKDKLYLPVYRMNVVQKYVGAGEGLALDKLGGTAFAKAKEKVREAVKRLALDLVELYAQRKIQAGIAFNPRDSAMREFEAKFPFEETPDQIKAIDNTLSDLSSGRVMDRLICGDVGYGKTEVAMRAAFRAVSDGKQVAILVPTTVLATQHELSFKTRFKDWPIRIESVSRFKSAKQQKDLLADAAAGKVDILVGTHRLLSRDVKFKDLGLIVVDEEHRFGVEHKEKLKTMRMNTHVLTLSATPIPRTLHMALSGLREITLMNTPPVDRLPIRTYVSKPDDSLIQRAIDFELKRGGQVFYLHNRVQSIYECASRIRELVPEAKISVAHGQMAEGELEAAMMEFYEKRSQVLVCTSIIESGLDLPSANTLIVERADLFGLAQLYQIRGRVGRGQNRGYAYLFVPAEAAVSEDARRRLEVIQRFVELGSGFQIASHDLEIRGGGDLLGAQQSGHINAVGFDLYTELLDEAIREIQGRAPTPEQTAREPEIKVPYAAYLSDTYIPDVHQRLNLYRRLSGAISEQVLEDLEHELEDRFGRLPQEAQNLLWLIRLKILLKNLRMDALTAGPERVSLVPGNDSALSPQRAIALIAAQPKKFQITPDSKVVVHLRATSLKDLYLQLDALLRDLAA